MKEAIIDNCTCPKCISRNFDLYTSSGKPIGYRSIVKDTNKSEVLEYLDKFQLYKFKCKDCNKSFNIDWRWGLPFPSDE